MNEVQCLGTEKSLWSCPFKNITQEDCKHTEDAAVRCNVPYMGYENLVRSTGSWGGPPISPLHPSAPHASCLVRGRGCPGGSGLAGLSPRVPWGAVGLWGSLGGDGGAAPRALPAAGLCQLCGTTRKKSPWTNQEGFFTDDEMSKWIHVALFALVCHFIHFGLFNHF